MQACEIVRADITHSIDLKTEVQGGKVIML